MTICTHGDKYHTVGTLYEDSTLHCTHENTIINFINLQVDVYLMLGDYPSYLDHLGCISCQFEAFPAKIQIYTTTSLVNFSGSTSGHVYYM